MTAPDEKRMAILDLSARILGVQVHLHWSSPPAALFVLLEGAFSQRWGVGLLHLGVFAAFLLLLLAQKLAQALLGGRLRLRTRELYLYPVGGYAQLATMGERPRGEALLGLAGILLGAAVALALAGLTLLAGGPLEPYPADTPASPQAFLNRLLWAQTLYGLANLLPAFPFDGAVLFRAALALTAGRMRATELAATLGTLVSLGLILADLGLLRNGLLGALALFTFVMSQYELVLTRYFFEMHQPQPIERGKQIGHVQVEQVIDPETRPAEANFSGFTWNARTRMWVEWRDGEPVSASAVLGE